MMKVDGIFGWREKWRLTRAWLRYWKFCTKWFIQSRTGWGEYGPYKNRCCWCSQDSRGYGAYDRALPGSEPYRRATLIWAGASAKDWKDLQRICDEMIEREENGEPHFSTRDNE